ncbi:hypothetical protein [Janthinobacterium sp.]|uniref:hypothetical protein n=1 Tax=Janthinobacterium sp. TaxID=1871054 RepID=UPI0026244AF7|nr:hypothetical protein [Janthinobacterium sp.]
MNNKNNVEELQKQLDNEVLQQLIQKLGTLEYEKIIAQSHAKILQSQTVSLQQDLEHAEEQITSLSEQIK